MTRFALTLLALAVVTAARAQPPIEALSGRVDSLEARVAALEARLSGTAAAQPAAGQKLSYADAYRQAVASNIPLLVWSGSAVCPPCVAATSGEWSNFVGTVEGLPTDCIVVGVPDGSGGIVQAGTVTEWVVNDPVRGHVPSVRRLLARHRSRAAGAGNYAYAAPAASYGVYGGFGGAFGGMAYGGGSYCASCQSSGGFGLFRRR